MGLVFISVMALCSASWLIRSFAERPLWSVPSDSDYYDTLPTDTNIYFSSGDKYNGLNQEPKINDDGALALFGCSAEEAEAQGYYKVEFIEGTYKNENLGKIKNYVDGEGNLVEVEGVVAGTHYYKITDTTTGQVISLKHEVTIEKSIYVPKESELQKPQATYFSGDPIGNLYAFWVNDTTGDKKSYTLNREEAEEFSIEEENSAVTAFSSGVNAGIEEMFKDNSDPLLRNNFEVIPVDLTYKVLPRCYVEQPGKKTYYSSLTKALKETKGATSATTVVALPSFTYEGVTYSSVMNTNGYTNEIDDDCEIGSMVTLWIPFDHTTESASNNGKTFIRTASSDATIPHQNTFNLDTDNNGSPDFRKNLVTVKAGVTITNKGKINVSAEITGGNGGTELAGMVSRNYAELQMKSDGESVSTITSVNGSYINCYGFITKSLANQTSLNPKIDMTSGSEMITMFTIVEHRGGTAFTDLCGGYLKILTGGAKPITSPFNQFFIQSVSADVNVNYGAAFKGTYVLNVSNSDVQGDIVIVGSDSAAFLQLNNSAGTAKMTYDVEQNKNVVEVKSDASVNPIAVKVSGIDISTKDVFLPISHYWHIDFMDMGKESGEATVLNIPSQRVKVLPGGYIKIHEGVAATLKSLAVYDTHTQIPPTSTNSHFIYPDKGVGTVVVDGSLKLTEGLGGNVLAGKEGAIIELAAASATSTELQAGADASGKVDVALNATGDILTSSTTVENKQFDVNTSYVSIGYNDNGTSKLVWVKRNVNITYVDVMLDEDGNIASYGDEAGVVKLHAVPNNFTHGFTKTGYVIDGYYTDKELTNELDPLTVLFDTKVYIKWKPTPTYPITYTPNYPGGGTGMTFSGGVAEAPAGTFTDVHTTCTVTDSGKLWNTDITKQYQFLGWSTTPNSTTPETSFEVPEGGLTLYGVWKKKVTITITVTKKSSWSGDRTPSITLTGGNADGTYSNSSTTIYVIEGSTINVSVASGSGILGIGGWTGQYTINGVGPNTGQSVITVKEDTTIAATVK